MLKIFKIGGGIIDNSDELHHFLQLLAQEKNPKILVHGGGKGANRLLEQLGIEPKMINGRRITDQETLDVEIDYGFVGDLNEESVNQKTIKSLLDLGLTPVFCAITHDKNGQLFNTNADTIASQIAIAMSKFYEVELNFCFDKIGVLEDINKDETLIPKIDQTHYQSLKSENKIFEGMIPKLDNAFEVINAGVKQVNLVHAKNINSDLKTVIC